MEEFAFHHVGIAVTELSQALEVYRDLLGYQLVTGPFDDLLQNVSVCFIRRSQSDPLLELVAPLGPDSPVDNILRRGGGTYHICYRTGNLPEAIEMLKSKGALLLRKPTPATAFEMREIAWMLSGKAKLLIELLQE